MNPNDRVLDLSGLGTYSFLGKIRPRHIFDWAEDYYEQSVRLAEVRLRGVHYRLFMHEVEKENLYVIKDQITNCNSIDFGHGYVRIIDVSRNEDATI